MLKDKLTEDLKAAMRAKDGARLRTIRSIRAALLEKEIAERQGGEASLSDDQEIAVLQKQAKQRRDAIEQYTAGGREDLVQKESEELAIIQTYLPQQLTVDEVRATVHQVIMGMGTISLSDKGKIMGESMRLLRGRAEGRIVQQVVQGILNNLKGDL